MPTIGNNTATHPEPVPETLEQTAAEINKRLELADRAKHKGMKARGQVMEARGQERYSRVFAGTLLLDAQVRVNARDGTNLSWSEWVEHHIDRGMRDCQRCMKLVRGKSPEQAAEAAEQEGQPQT